MTNVIPDTYDDDPGYYQGTRTVDYPHIVARENRAARARGVNVIPTTNITSGLPQNLVADQNNARDRSVNVISNTRGGGVKSMKYKRHRVVKKTRRNKNTRNKSMRKYIWSKYAPNARQRTAMLQKCGKKCFLGPHKSYPICRKHTCTRDKAGVHAAYVRARSQHNRPISKRSKILNKLD